MLFLGHCFDLKERCIEPERKKLKSAATSIRCTLRSKTCVPRWVAAAAGKLLDMAKSIQNRHPLPKIIMRLATVAVHQNQLTDHHAHLQRAWSRSTPKRPRLRYHLALALAALNSPIPVVASVHQNVGSHKIEVDASLTE